jgi:hypothetical protein
MLQDIFNNNNQGATEEGQDPFQPQPQGPGQGRPAQTASFDVQQNPQDMQMMTDAMMYVPMLKKMDEDERRENWPQIANKLGQVSPKARAMLDPTTPPDDNTLDAMMAKMPQAASGMPVGADTPLDRRGYMDDQVERQMKGLPPITPEEYRKQKEAGAQEAPRPEGGVEPGDEDIMKGAVSQVQKGVKGLHAGADWLKDDADEGDPYLKGAPKGYAWVDPSSSQTKREKGLVEIKKILTNAKKDDKKGMSPDKAAKIMMMRVGRANLPIVKSHLFNEDGTVNRANVGKANIPIIGGAVPWSSGAKSLAQGYEHGIQGITRGETGAAMPDGEVDNTRERYQCNVWDTDESCTQKYLSFELFMNGYLDLTHKGKDGKGHFDTAKADALDAQLKLNLLGYKKKWMQQAIKDNPNRSQEELSKYFTTKLVTDPEFVKKVGKQLRAFQRGKK